MKILHTSDWHLGVNHGPVSRAPDHERFLAWLLDRLRTSPVDVLVVAGDIFDTLQPSAEALAAYYTFLARLPGCGVRKVVIVGGNHDSASRLDAPRDVLDALDVHVVGGILGTHVSWERCLVPVTGEDGTVRGVLLAVPYVHEFRLGVRTTDTDVAGARAQFLERFGGLYTWLADEAERRWPNAPLIATGHLTVGSADRDDYPEEIHQVGTLDALPASLFDPRIRYVALGHLHRAHPAGGDPRIWYSGTPITLSLHEARTPRFVLEVTIPEKSTEDINVNAISVPPTRSLLELRDAPDAIIARLRDLRWPAEQLPPLLFLRVITDTAPPDLSGRLLDAIASHPEAARPTIVEVRQERASEAIADADRMALTTSLDEMQPLQVFETLCRSKHGTTSPELSLAFSQLTQFSDDDFEDLLRQVEAGA